MNMAKDRLHGRKTLKVNNFLDEFEKDDVKKYVDIVDLFHHFGITLVKKGKSHMARCPWHEDTNPSLSVDRDKGVYNCFGCGESGDVFTLTEKVKGVSFKDALAFLKNEYRAAVTATGASPPPLSADGHESDEDPSAVRAEGPESEGLGAVAEYYHKRLYKNERALEYLKTRGLRDLRLYDRFNLGFADGSLLGIIGESRRKELADIGILSDRGFEHFKGCITFPIVDELGQVVGMYGRSIGPDAKVPHLYLKGKHSGVFHRKASTVFDEIILTESIIDALSLIEMGIENVQAIYGTNGLTEEHVRILRDDRVKTAVLAFDADEAGRRSSDTLAERFMAEGFTVKVIQPGLVLPFIEGGGKSVEGLKDWNDYLIRFGDPTSIREALRCAEVVPSKIDLASAIRGSEAPPAGQVGTGVVVTKEAHAYTFAIGELVYRVNGVKELFIGSLKVNIKAEIRADAASVYVHYDDCNLYSARSRASYSSNLSRECGVEAKRIEKDLVVILEYLEAERDRKLVHSNRETAEELSDEDRRLGMELLRDPSLMTHIIEHMELLGYVGEDLNKLLLYLVASSRKLDDPISVIVVSQSASGKSMLVDTVKKLMPPDEVIAVTSLSDQALNYVRDLNHKFLILGEAVHNEVIEHQLREMLSAHELTRLVTVKNDKTGTMETRIVKTEAIVATAMTTTDHSINPENASRCFLLHADESREQTAKIHETQRRRRGLARRQEERDLIPGIIRTHVAAQRLLRKIAIVNPFAEHITFPDALMRTRRDHDRFLDLIDGVCFLRQYQKEIRRDGGIEYIECDLEDYRVACTMLEAALAAAMRDIPAAVIQVYEDVRTLAHRLARRGDLKSSEVTVTQREIREYTGQNQVFVKRSLRLLVDYEYLAIVRGGGSRTKGHYRLKEDAPIEAINLSMIPRPGEMERIIKEKSGKGERKI